MRRPPVIETLDIDGPPEFTLRPYQVEFIEAVREGWKEATRLLGVMGTGLGKTVVFAKIAQEEVAKGGRVLVIAHTDELLEQAIDKIYRATDIMPEKEKADEKASFSASIVVASVQTISRDRRLTSWPDNHFTLVICDESHRSLATSYQKVLNYFHFGSESLAEGWVAPEIGVAYQHKARCLGVTATADRGDKRSLGEFYQKCVFEFGLLEACREGWLVRPIVKNIPVKIDLKGVKKTAGDYDAAQVVERISPFLKQLAAAMAPDVRDRKTVIFTPSIETARLMAEAMREQGLAANFVSGACTDRDEKIAAFDAAGPGAVITCAMLLIEGWDSPTASCVSVLRPTRIRSLFVQATGRGTRPLPGVVDGLETKEERLAAIAASRKPDLLIIDPLWLTDRMDLVQPVDLVATRPDLREAVAATGITDLIEAERQGERDLLKSLEQAAKAHARKKARTIDPLSWAVSLGDAALAAYEPESKWEEQPARPAQLALITKFGMETNGIWCAGLADKIIGRLLARAKLKLATPKQLHFMDQLGIPEDKRNTLTVAEASALIDRVTGKKRE